MGAIRRLEGESARILRGVSSSPCIRFGSAIPHGKPGPVGFASIGFADIAAVGFEISTKDPSGFVPQARQLIFETVRAAGLSVDALALRVYVGEERRKRGYIDANPDSPTVGKNKIVPRVRYYVEIDVRELVPRFRAGLPRVYL